MGQYAVRVLIDNAHGINAIRRAVPLILSLVLCKTWSDLSFPAQRSSSRTVCRIRRFDTCNRICRHVSMWLAGGRRPFLVHAMACNPDRAILQVRCFYCRSEHDFVLGTDFRSHATPFPSFLGARKLRRHRDGPLIRDRGGNLGQSHS